MSDTNGSTPSTGKKVRQWDYKFEGNTLVVTGRDGGSFAGQAMRYDLDRVTEPAVRAEMLRNGGRQALGDALNTRGVEAANARFAAWCDGQWELAAERGPAFPESVHDLSADDKDIFVHAYAQVMGVSPKSAPPKIDAALADPSRHALLQGHYSRDVVRSAMRGIKTARNAAARAGATANAMEAL